MNYELIAQVVALVAIANTAPLLATRVFGSCANLALDCGIGFLDGRPLLGPTKTWRGVASSVAATALIAPLIGLSMSIGTTIAAAAMLGDLLSSFVKRRLGLVPSSRASGLDQIPESLLPVIAASMFLSITLLEGAVIVTMFVVGEVLLARLFFQLGLRDRPY